MELLCSSSDKAKFFTKNFSKNGNLDYSDIFLPVFPARTNLKLLSFRNSQDGIIMNLDSSKSSGPDIIPVVVLKKCEPELFVGCI